MKYHCRSRGHMGSLSPEHLRWAMQILIFFTVSLIGIRMIALNAARSLVLERVKNTESSRASRHRVSCITTLEATGSLLLYTTHQQEEKHILFDSIRILQKTLQTKPLLNIMLTMNGYRREIKKQAILLLLAIS